MALIIPLRPVPNQALSVRLAGLYFDLTVKALGNGIMALSLTREGKTLVKNTRALPLEPILPYRYLEEGGGNLYWITENDSYPHYSRFGGADTLRYLTAEELARIRP